MIEVTANQDGSTAFWVIFLAIVLASINKSTREAIKARIKKRERLNEADKKLL